MYQTILKKDIKQSQVDQTLLNSNWPEIPFMKAAEDLLLTQKVKTYPEATGQLRRLVRQNTKQGDHQQVRLVTESTT